MNFDKQKQKIDEFLDKHLPKEDEEPSSIIKAMRYSVFAGGKRIRPIISLIVNEMLLLGSNQKDIYFPACALELIHTYSLIHDDLPALDNDDFRRGKPSCHNKFGEAIALLAGDALLTLSFDWLSRDSNKHSISVIRLISNAAGINGMIGGQVVDFEMTGRGWNGSNTKHLEDKLLYIHKNKTAAIIQSAFMIGAIYAGVDGELLGKISKLGNNIGLAFQIVDDILDVEGETETLGKTKGKDQKDKKLTFPSIYGLELSKKKARDLINESKDILSQFDNREKLIQMIDLIYRRNS